MKHKQGQRGTKQPAQSNMWRKSTVWPSKRGPLAASPSDRVTQETLRQLELFLRSLLDRISSCCVLSTAVLRSEKRFLGRFGGIPKEKNRHSASVMELWKEPPPISMLLKNPLSSKQTLQCQATVGSEWSIRFTELKGQDFTQSLSFSEGVEHTNPSFFDTFYNIECSCEKEG